MGQGSKIKANERYKKNKKNSNNISKTCGLPVVVRNLVGKIASLLYDKKILTQQEIIDFFLEVNISIPKQTLSRWIILNDTLGVAVPIGSGCGAPHLLDELQEDVVAGYVLQQNLGIVPVHRHTVVAYVMEAFGIPMTDATAGSYLSRWGFSLHKVKLRDSSYVVDRNDLVNSYCDWLLQHRMFVKPSMVCSLDFTYTSHRTRQEEGVSLRGAGSPQGAKSISRYTNCIATCVWADGVVRTPCVLFTLNQQFRTDRSETDRREGQMQKLHDALRRYKIAEERIIYCGASTGESKTYCAESPSFVRRFFDMYPFLNSAIKIFTDDGNCFMENGEDVLAQMGFKDRVVYAPVFHHYASPNDNSVHGDAKKKWREMFHDFTDDVTTSIALMSYIDKASKNAGLYFHRNLQFGSPYGSQVVRADVENVCHCTFTELSLRRLIAYRMFEDVDGRGEHEESVRELSSALDGIYYQKTSNQ